jgi:hypothetical protein
LDTPGFFDSRTPYIDIIHKYGLRNLLYLANLKIVFVQDYNELLVARGKNFKENFQILASMI